MRFFCLILTLSILASASADADTPSASSKSARRKSKKKEKKPTKVIKLNDDNYDERTEGKHVFIKYYAPWCAYCKAVKEDWEKLAVEWAENETGLIGQVDCTRDDTDRLCDDVAEFPVFKYGEPKSLEEYHGQTDYEDLSDFAKEYLKPRCGVSNIELCDDSTKADIARYRTLNTTQLEDLVDDIHVKIVSMETEATERTVELEKEINDVIAQFTKDATQFKEISHFKHIMDVLREIDPEYDPDDIDHDEDLDLSDEAVEEL